MVFPPLFTVEFSYISFILSSVLFHFYMFYVFVVYSVVFKCRGIKPGESVRKVQIRSVGGSLRNQATGCLTRLPVSPDMDRARRGFTTLGEEA